MADPLNSQAPGNAHFSPAGSKQTLPTTILKQSKPPSAKKTRRNGARCLCGWPANVHTQVHMYIHTRPPLKQLNPLPYLGGRPRPLARRRRQPGTAVIARTAVNHRGRRVRRARRRLLAARLRDLRHPVADEGGVYPPGERGVAVLQGHLGAVHQPQAAEDAEVSPLLEKKQRTSKNKPKRTNARRRNKIKKGAF